MNPIEIKALRLEREQVALLGVIAEMIDDVQMLLRYVDADELDPREAGLILSHQSNAIRTLDNLIQGT